jgi:hypothetical protein
VICSYSPFVVFLNPKYDLDIVLLIVKGTWSNVCASLIGNDSIMFLVGKFENKYMHIDLCKDWAQEFHVI